MRILFICENYLPHIGGVEIVFKNLAEGLVKKGHQVSLITHRLKGTKKKEEINGVKIFRVPSFFSRYLFTFFSIPLVIKLAGKHELIQTTTFNGAFPAWLGGKLRRKPAVITVHEVWAGKWDKLTEMRGIKAKFHDWLERLIYFLKFDRYICVSESTKRQLSELGVKEGRLKLVYNGVDYEHWEPRRYDGKKIREELGLEKNFVYLFYGRPGISKGLEYLIKAVPLIAKEIPRAKLLAIISKDKAYLKRYKYIFELIRKLKVEDKVKILNPVSYKELPGYVKAADCVVVPSLAEGFGFTAAESCAMGKPVVASRTTSLPEVVSGKYVLVEARRAEEIAKGVKLVFKKRFVKSKLKRFESEDNIGSYIKAYEELLR